MKKLILLILSLATIFIFSCGESTEMPVVETTVTVDPFVGSIDEGATAGSYIGTVNATTNQGAITYSLSNMSRPGAVTISASVGDISVADALVFNFETTQQITATVTATNGDISEDATVTININDVDESEPRVIWSGSNVTFTKDSGADPTEEANQDRITDNVWITRGNDGGQIFNIKAESAYAKDSSPSGTAWAIGKIDDIDNLTFKPFREALGGKPKDQVNTDLVMHLIDENIYLSLKITNWEENKNGGFTYERSSE